MGHGFQRHLRVRRAQRHRPPSTRRGERVRAGSPNAPDFIPLARAPRSERLLRGDTRGPQQPRHRARLRKVPRRGAPPPLRLRGQDPTALGRRRRTMRTDP